jgi:hypothetical protein
MTVDCGTQIRLGGARRRTGPGVARTETFRQKEVQRFDADYLIRAREHSAGRNRAAWRLLAILSFLRNYNSLPAHAQVNWDRAHLQAIAGDQYSDAAHNLPCQILVGGQFPWIYVSGNDIDAPRIISELREGFGGVYVTPKVFNVADSIAEASCLRGALVDACAEVIAKSTPVPRKAGVVKRGVGESFGMIELTRADLAIPGAGVDQSAVASAYQTWLVKSTAAFDRAIRDVEGSGATSMGQDVSDDVIYILRRYKQFAQTAIAPTAANLSQLEEAFWRAG